MSEENTVLVNLNMRNTILVSMLILVIYRTLSIRPVHWMMLAWNLTVIMSAGTALVFLNEYIRGTELEIPAIPYNYIMYVIIGLLGGAVFAAFGFTIMTSAGYHLYFLIPESDREAVFFVLFLIGLGVMLGGGYIIKKALNKERTYYRRKHSH